MFDMAKGEAPQGLGGMIVAESVEVRLRNKRERLQKQVEDIDAAIKILDEQPKLLETLNLLRKVGI